MTDIFEKRDEVLDEWVRTFLATALDAGADTDYFKAGDSGGEVPEGIKIIFEAYSEDDDGNLNKDDLCFAVFIHKESVNGLFPEHDGAYNMVIHRPREEMYFFVWFNTHSDEVTVLPDCEFAWTDMKEEEAIQLFSDVINRLGLTN